MSLTLEVQAEDIIIQSALQGLYANIQTLDLRTSILDHISYEKNQNKTNISVKFYAKKVFSLYSPEGLTDHADKSLIDRIQI